jgi:hypothetical protein
VSAFGARCGLGCWKTVAGMLESHEFHHMCLRLVRGVVTSCGVIDCLVIAFLFFGVVL